MESEVSEESTPHTNRWLVFLAVLVLLLWDITHHGKTDVRKTYAAECTCH